MIPATCTVCRTARAVPAYTVDGWRIVRCCQCRHLYVSPRPDMDEIHRIYDQTYFQNPAFHTTDHDAYFGYMDYLRDRVNIQRRLIDVLHRIENEEPPGRLLDVGCGLGFFVEVAELGGWEAHGVDVNKHAVEWANDHVSDRILHSPVETLDYADEYFDCVTMFDVVEHLDDPRAELSEVWRVLRPGGLFVVATPDAGSLMARLLGARWLEMKRAPEHLHFFDRAGLTQLLRASGFEMAHCHSMGKVTTVRTVLADLKFYSPSVCGAVERAFERRGWNDRVVDLDPRTKMCVYARKTGEPTSMRPPSQSTNGQRFEARQRRFWERKRRFLDPRDPGPEAFVRPKLDWVAEHVDVGRSTSVLDVGAGNGTFTWYWAERAGPVVGVDFSTNLLSRSPCPERMVQADIGRLPFGDARFDVVSEGNVLHHAADPVATLMEMARVARRHLVLVEPNRWHVPMAAFMAAVPAEWHGLRFDARFVERLAASAGLRVVAVAPQGAIYPNMTPSALLRPLARFDRPSRWGGYVVAILEKHSQG